MKCKENYIRPDGTCEYTRTQCIKKACRFFQPPMTNADRIRAMSDEELAEWMAECNAYGEHADASQWLPWLQQPAEGKA